MQPSMKARRAARAAAREADARRRDWERMRQAHQPVDVFQTRGSGHPSTPLPYPPGGASPPGAAPGGAPAPGPSSALWAAAAPLVAAAGVVVMVTAGTPAVTGNWQPLWLLAGAAVAATGAWSALRCFEDGHHGRTFVSSVLGLLVVAAMALGLHGQTVVDGRARLSSGQTAAGARELQEATEALATLRANQQLLNLTPEQAVALLGEYQIAVDTDLALAGRWNPATAGTLPGGGISAVYEAINRVAVWQSDAIAGFAMNLDQPVPDIAAEVERLRGAIDAQIAPGGPIEQLIDAAWRESTGSSEGLLGTPVTSVGAGS